MDVLTFIAEIVKAIAWPTVVLIIFLVFRRPLRDLIPLLEQLRYKDIELNFGRRVKELSREAQKELPTSTAVEALVEPLREKLKQLATLSPRAVVLESWLEVEEAAVEAIKKHGISLKSQELKSPITLEAALAKAGILDENKRQIFRQLRNLRNAAAHASEFTVDADSAIDYADFAIRLAEFLRQA
jgi:hypothetical protein